MKTFLFCALFLLPVSALACHSDGTRLFTEECLVSPVMDEPTIVDAATPMIMVDRAVIEAMAQDAKGEEVLLNIAVYEFDPATDSWNRAKFQYDEQGRLKVAPK